jgi:hypothetical protein
MTMFAIEDAFPPELASTRLPFELANELANRGHEVTAVSVFPRGHLFSGKIRKPKDCLFYRKKKDDFLFLRATLILKLSRS